MSKKSTNITKTLQVMQKHHHWSLNNDDLISVLNDYSSKWYNQLILQNLDILKYNLLLWKNTILFRPLNKTEWKKFDFVKKSQLPKPLHFVIDNLEDNEIPFRYIVQSSFGKMTKHQILKNTITNNFINEVIPSLRPRRPYFDIDAKLDKSLLTKILKALKNMFGDNVLMAISGSYGYKFNLNTKKLYEEKFYSFHITLPEFAFKNKDEQNMSGFNIWAGHKAHGIGADNIYGANQNYKMVNQKKNREGDDRIQNILDENSLKQFTDEKVNLSTVQEHHMANVLPADFEKHKDASLIEFPNFDNKRKKKSSQKRLTSMKAEERQKEVKRSPTAHDALLDIRPLDTENIETPTIDFQYDTAVSILMKIPNCVKSKYKLSRRLYFNVCNWYINFEGGDREILKLWDERYLEWNHGEEDQCFGHNDKKWEELKNTKYHPYTRRTIRLLFESIYDCKFGNYNLELYKSDFCKRINCTLVDELDKNGKCYIKPKHLNKLKYQFLGLNMNGGKTYTVIDVLKHNPYASVLWITNRTSFADNIFERLIENLINDFEFHHYHDTQGLKGKNLQKLLQSQKRLVIENESLWKIQDRKEAYDFVIIDEIESVWNAFGPSNCHGKNLTKNWYTLTKCLQSCKQQVFLMDAFLANRTIKICNNIEAEANQTFEHNLVMRKKEYDTLNRHVIIHKYEHNHRANIIDDLKNGKKLYVFYPFKSGTDNTAAKSIESIEVYAKRLCEDAGLNPEKNKIVHHADSGDTLKGKLKNVTELWGNTDIKLVVVNSTITVGINYEKNDFDKVYISYGNWISARDVIQSSMRIRNPKCNIIQVYEYPNIELLGCLKTGKTYAPFEEDNRASLIGNEQESWTILQDSLLLEKRANGFNMLLEYMKRTGYKISKSSKALNTKARDLYLETYKGKDSAGEFSWNAISSIDLERYNKLRDKILDPDKIASLKEKLEHHKFQVERHFTKDGKVHSSQWWKCQDELKIFLDIGYTEKQYNINMANAGSEWERNEITAEYEYRKDRKRLYEMVMLYNKEKREFEYNDRELTQEDKSFIHKRIHPKCKERHLAKYLTKTDNVIKKELFKIMFPKFKKDKHGLIRNNHSGKYSFSEKFICERLEPAINDLRCYNDKQTILDGTCHIDLDDEDDKIVMDKIISGYCKPRQEDKKKCNPKLIFQERNKFEKLYHDKLKKCLKELKIKEYNRKEKMAKLKLRDAEHNKEKRKKKKNKEERALSEEFKNWCATYPALIGKLKLMQQESNTETLEKQYFNNIKNNVIMHYVAEIENEVKEGIEDIIKIDGKMYIHNCISDCISTLGGDFLGVLKNGEICTR